MSKFKTSPRDNNNSSDVQILDIPTKVISTTAKIQFTCTVSEIPIAGRADIKVAKFLISKITPIRMIVLRGSTHDCDTLVAHAKSAQIQAISPSNNETVNFSISIDRIKLQIPLNYFPILHNRHSIKGFNTSMKDTTCTLSALQGTLIEVVSRDSSGLRTLRLQSTTVPIQTPAQIQAKLEEEKLKVVKPKTLKKQKKLKVKKQDNVEVAIKNEDSVPIPSKVETKEIVIKTEKVNANIKPVDIAIDTTATSGESILATSATTNVDVTATMEPTLSMDVVPAPATTATAAALDFNALDVDAFFNSMASELMDTTVTTQPAAATVPLPVLTTAAVTPITTLFSTTTATTTTTVTPSSQPQSSINLYPPLSKVSCVYPDTFGDYADLLPSASSVSDILKINQLPIASIDEFEDETNDVAVVEVQKVESHEDSKEDEDDEESEFEDEEEDEDNVIYDKDMIPAISVGEITLNTIKSQMEKLGYQVEFKMSSSGATLICDSQVIIRKKETIANHFIVEGVPVKAFWDAKNIVSDKFAFINKIS